MEVDDGSTGRRTFVVLMVGVLLLLLTLGVVGYRAFRGQSTATVGVDATEEVVTPSADRARRSQPPAAGTDLATTPATSPAHETAPLEAPPWALVAEDTRAATNADDALGLPDERAAAVAPGGALALGSATGEPFYNGPGVDVEVYGRGGTPARYTIYARDAADSRWVRFDVHSRGFSTTVAGHDMGHHGIQQARQIMIRNDGRADLYIDAVRPRYRTPAGHTEGHTDAPRHR